MATDTNMVEVYPLEDPQTMVPLHTIGIRHGPHAGRCSTWKCSRPTARADGAWEFFAAAPLPVTGGVGSPINPLAIKWQRRPGDGLAQHERITQITPTTAR